MQTMTANQELPLGGLAWDQWDGGGGYNGGGGTKGINKGACCCVLTYSPLPESDPSYLIPNPQGQVWSGSPGCKATLLISR